MRDYISFSTWSNYKECEAAALARDKGELEFETTEPMLVSMFVEAHLIGTEDEIQELYEKHPEILNSRTGKPKVAYTRAVKAAEQAKNDPIFMAMLAGDKQQKLEGEIEGIKIMGYADNIAEGSFITDLKAVANFNRTWDPRARHKVSFIEFRNYHVQGYMYRLMYKQMTGHDVPFFIAALTKEDPSQRVIARFEDKMMEAAEREFIPLARRIVKLRKGEEEPVNCGVCDYCKATMSTQVLDAREVGMSTSELEDYRKYLAEVEGEF